MTIALSDFWARIISIGVTDAAGCREIAKAYAEKSDGTPPSDAPSLARFLVTTGQLNKFQAKALLDDAAPEIRFGGFLQTEPSAAAAPLGRWIHAGRPGAGHTSGFLFPIAPNRFPAGASADPDQCMQWLSAHASVSHDNLQPIELHSSAAGSSPDLVFSKLDPTGQSLAQRLNSGRPEKTQLVTNIGIQLCQALDILHQAGVSHGGVRADRVWISGQDDVVLLREPIGPPESPLLLTENPPNGGVCLLDTFDSPVNYAAPEFATSVACTAQSDIYSLGCLLFHLASGRSGFAATSPAETFAAHQSAVPPELAAAVDNAQSGDPLMRVIAYAVAKTPESRFATAGRFADALKAVQNALPVESDPPTVATPPKASAVDTTPIAPSQVTPPQTRKVASPTTKNEKPVVAKPADPPPNKPRKTSASEPTQTVPAVEKKRPETVSEPPPLTKPTAAKPTSSETLVPTAKVAPPAESETEPAPKPTADSASLLVADASPEKPPAVSIPADTRQESPPAKTNPEPPLRRRKRRKKKSPAPMILGGMGIVSLLLLVLFLVLDPSAGEPERKPRFRPPPPAVVPSVVSKPLDSQQVTPTAEIDGYEVVADDNLPWAPPYPIGQSVSLGLLPPGPQLIAWVRPNDLVKSKVYQSLKPELAGLLDKIVSRTKVTIESVESCGIAIHTGQSGVLETSFAVTLSKPQQLSELTERWGAAESRTATGETIYAGDEPTSDAFFAIIDDDSVSGFAVGSIDRISEVAEMGGGTIPLPRSLEKLWQSASENADFHLMVQPNFLFADGRDLLSGTVPEMVDPLKALLVPDASGILISVATQADTVYFETRMTPSGGLTAAELARQVSTSVKSWPQWANNFVVDTNPDPSWKLLALRLPFMIQFVQSQVRVGVSNDAALANAYLPNQAAAQTGLATVLAMNTTASTGIGTAAPTAEALTLDQMLDRQMSVSFDQESLEFAIDAIVQEFQGSLPKGSQLPPVRIIGSDLEKMGITQNQQIRDFAKSDKPLRSVLTDLVLGANPDKSATGPEDPKQALVWVVADDPETPGKPAILVTTRLAAKGKYKLPKEFGTN